MDRIVAKVPESVEELCLVRMGLVARKLSAMKFVARMARLIDQSAVEAMRTSAGLLASDRFHLAWGHFGVLQYWSSFDALDAWSHAPPHADWWREALVRVRTREDFGIYHEIFLVPRRGIESIYLGCPPVGVGTFGVKGEAVGPATTSRDRLGRRAGRG